MNRMTVTIVDVLGLLVPGVVLLFACMLAPIPLEQIQPLNEALLQRLPLLTNPWVSGGCWLAAAYLLGFLIRLSSIGLMNRLTLRRWSGRLEREAKLLDEIFEPALANPGLSKNLRELAKQTGERDPGRYAPYFHFAKRLVRGHPDLWTEAERLEAEVRFAAGLFIPFLVLALDGVFRGLATGAAWILFAVGIGGASLVLSTYPSRRVKEVLYDECLALVALLYPPSPTSQSPGPKP